MMSFCSLIPKRSQRISQARCMLQRVACLFCSSNSLDSAADGCAEELLVGAGSAEDDEAAEAEGATTASLGSTSPPCLSDWR
eukprot:11826398-Alexandrium_andersonii.AAC.1